MLNARQLFAGRLSAHVKKLSRYLRYILTGHMMIAMVFIISAMSVYYQRFLEEIPESFPSAWLIAIVLGSVTAYSPLQTLLKKADIIFLLPAENQLSGFFLRTWIYSYFTQLYIFAFAFAALAPLYMAVFPENASYTWLFLFLLIVKAWSLAANWWMLRVRDKQTRLLDKAVRTALIIVMVYFYINQETIFLIIVSVLLITLLSINFYLANKHKALNWDVMIESDYLRMRSFYRLANMFTDVPHLETPIKKRHFLARLITKHIPFRQNQAYLYLYRLTTVRSGEYLGIYLRLLVIGGLLIYFVPNEWLKLIFALLFLYMLFLQLVPLWKHHATIVWLDLYPVQLQIREQSFVKWLQQLTAAAAILFSLLLLLIGEWLISLLMIAASIIVVLLIIPRYLEKKMAFRTTNL